MQFKDVTIANETKTTDGGVLLEYVQTTLNFTNSAIFPLEFTVVDFYYDFDESVPKEKHAIGQVTVLSAKGKTGFLASRIKSDTPLKLGEEATGSLTFKVIYGRKGRPLKCSIDRSLRIHGKLKLDGKMAFFAIDQVGQ